MTREKNANANVNANEKPCTSEHTACGESWYALLISMEMSRTRVCERESGKKNGNQYLIMTSYADDMAF